MSSQPANILFYSTKCQTCNFFMTQSQKMGLLKYFKLICVDGQEKVFMAKGLKIIPTIMVQNNSGPIEGKNCLVWLENIYKSQKNKNIDNPNDQFLPETGMPSQPPIPPNSPQFKQTQPPLQNNGQMGQMGKINQINQMGQSGGNSNNSSQQNQNQFQVPNTNVVKRQTNVAQPPPLPTTNIKGKQVPNPSVQPNQLNNNGGLNSIQSSQANLIQINSGNNGNNNGLSVKTKSQLFGFLENEMAGCSDTYAYLLVDNALPKSFLPPDKDLQIYTAPEGNKLDKKTQEMYIKNMEMFRDNDKEEYKKLQEQQQREAIQNNLRK